MNKKIIIGILTILLISGIVALLKNSEDNQAAFAATVYKSPTCGCCTVYGQYLKRQGVDVETVTIDDLSNSKEENGIPRELESCHTSVVGGYVVEGHVPLPVIETFLEKSPDIKGIALPGMPAGSPGMPGLKQGKWTIYAIAHDGSVSEFMDY
ncbi:MAG: hypothetical protein COU08_02370 [Candidatus Harrisonbacteria bacterium CG10_big_fil_rev_8_21_14_0_10_42_17]|uniref:CopG family transcriptional regulator n=1 Tax=Candidatus Harrisonbacteria bacterium CG10_big_fil_rev_8_21_14_0_10_42_17 TaxID=1974584 RepID=A0A2M6WI83_9BACT|nr:MAG: hypothetical protein COU08_02370 [Candidatus Harrisonbacteria bacterium CG10_big_fil_rev_8_21_14_0_10_42_17]